jgi:hypothetical protein
LIFPLEISANFFQAFTMRFESILLPLATVAVGVDALGINCRGSANCMLYGANVSKDMVK